MIRKHCLASYLTTSLLCISLRVVVGDLSRFCNSDSMPVRGGACGSRLAIILDTVCKSGFAGYYKRSVPDNVRAEVQQHQAELETFLPRSQAQSFLKGGSFKKRSHMHQGIVCECCYNVCTFREMTEYCKGDDAAVSIHVTKKSTHKYAPVPDRYARGGAGKMAARLQTSRTGHGAVGRLDSLETSGDRESEVGPANNLAADLTAEETDELRETEKIYLRNLLAKDRYPTNA